MAKEYRLNEKIRAREVRVIDETGQNLGVMPLAQAVNLARQRDADLVEVSPTAVPPVCRILDYGRFRYEQSKKERKTRKKASELHQIRLRPKIGQHDMEFKVRTIQRFLQEGHKVRISVRLRGREQAHPELGKNLLERVFQALTGTARAEGPAVLEGRDMVVTILPARPTGKTAHPAGESKPEAAAPAPVQTTPG